MMKKLLKLSLIIFILMNSCTTTDQPGSEVIPSPAENLWPEYSKKSTIFKLWSPKAEEVRLNLYKSGNDSPATDEFMLTRDDQGIWSVEVPGDLNRTYYTYQVRMTTGWLAPTPGI